MSTTAEASNLLQGSRSSNSWVWGSFVLNILPKTWWTLSNILLAWGFLIVVGVVLILKSLRYAGNCSYFPYLKIMEPNLSKIYILNNHGSIQSFFWDMVNFSNVSHLYFMLKIQLWYHSFTISSQLRIDFKYYKLNFNPSNQIEHNFCLSFNLFAYQPNIDLNSNWKL